ncbi:MAG: hypothetical protein NVSMB9_08250 [Isosphaeraceae bacterium]
MSDSGKSQSVLGPFLGYFADFKKLLAMIIALGAAPTIMDLVFTIGPPWPHRRGIILLTSLGAWVLLLWSYSAWRKTSQKVLKARLSACAVAAASSLLVYILLHAFFVYDAPTYKNQEAKGFLLRPEIQGLLLSKAKSGGTIEDLLEGAEYVPTVIWVSWTVYLIRYLLMSTWLILFGSLSLVASAFLLLQEKLSLSQGSQEWGSRATTPKRREPRKQASPATKEPSAPDDMPHEPPGENP